MKQTNALSNCTVQLPEGIVLFKFAIKKQYSFRRFIYRRVCTSFSHINIRDCARTYTHSLGRERKSFFLLIFVFILVFVSFSVVIVVFSLLCVIHEETEKCT